LSITLGYLNLRSSHPSFRTFLTFFWLALVLVWCGLWSCRPCSPVVDSFTTCHCLTAGSQLLAPSRQLPAISS